MPKFNAEEYRKKLEKSTSCETCEKIPVSKLNSKTRYIFISYSHKDYKKVYSDLAYLYESDIPFWYDEGLPSGKNWDVVVTEKMTDPRCAGVIFYMSEDLFLSRSIQSEISIVFDNKDDDLEDKYELKHFSVNLTDKLPSKILDNVFLKKEFADSDDAMQDRLNWISQLAKAFPDKATFLPYNSPQHKENLIEQINVNFGIMPNYNLFSFSDATFCSGNAVIKFESGSEYNGEFKNGLFDGKGVLTFYDGAVYDGEWLNGKRHGYGKINHPNGVTYAGVWCKDKPHGKGRATYEDGSYYEGEWVNGVRHGHGVRTFINGTVYSGEMANNKRNGYGTVTHPNGRTYTGDWVDNLPHGKGRGSYEDGSYYEGEWLNGKRHGKGRYTLADGSVQEGIFEKDVYIGPQK